MLKTKSLAEKDGFLLITDKYTHKHLMTETPFTEIKNHLHCTQGVLINKQPKTLMEGCMWKYTSFTENTLRAFNQDIFFYCDIDIILNKSLKIITNAMIPNSIVVHEEIPFINSEFSEGIPEDEKKEIMKDNPHLLGLSAGKFAIYGIALVKEIFSRIIVYYDTTTKYETLEQPLFNRAVFNYVTIEKRLPSIHQMNAFCTRYTTYNTNYILYDCCGRPGDTEEHMEKIINITSFLTAMNN
jgi:hypothetical protein